MGGLQAVMPGRDLSFAALQINERKRLHQLLMSRLQGGQSGQTEPNEVRGAAACRAVRRAPGLLGRAMVFMQKAAVCMPAWRLNSATAEKASTRCGKLAAAMSVAYNASPPSRHNAPA